MTWCAAGAVKILGAAAAAGLLSLGLAGVLAQAAPASSVSSVSSASTKAPAKDRSDRLAIAKAVFDSEASALGITPEALRADVKNGQAVSDLARAKGWDKTAYGAKLLETLTPRLKALVDTHVIRQAQADKAVDRIKKGHIPFWDGRHHRKK